MGAETSIAPSFMLQLANGDPVTLKDLWLEHHLVLWFSRGLVCPVCRRQMVQLAQIYDELKGAGTQVVQITPTDLEVSRRMMKFFPVAWPYACDPRGEVATAYEMEPTVGAIGRVGLGLKEQTKAWRVLIRTPTEPHPEVLSEVKEAGPLPSRDGGIVVVDRQGRIRFKQPTGKLSLLPSNTQILSIMREIVSGKAA